MIKKNGERRTYNRYKVCSPLNISTSDFNLDAQIKDISCAGVLCCAGRYIPLQTKLTVSMSLAVISERKKVSRYFSCHGLVARIDPPDVRPETEYEIGIAFPELQKEEKDMILKFVRQRNLKESRELRNIYMELKEMVHKLSAVEQAHPTAEHFCKVINQAISELDGVAQILDVEIMELKNLR